MKFTIKISPFMEKQSSPLGSIEDRLIRIPSRLREEFGLSPGLFLCLNSKSEYPISLQVSTAYRKDIEEDDECVFVSQDTHSLLDLEKIGKVEPANDVLIGCDPEFFLIDKGSGYNISASHFFPYYGDVGSDCGLAELRPRPGFKEFDVSKNILDLMKKAYSHIYGRTLYRKRDIHMIGASHWNNAAAGYHIHFGLPQFMLRMTPETIKLLSYMVNVLDYYVGISAILPEGSEDCQRRSGGHSRYGKPGDFRADDMMTLEYRVPGGHLLRHPILSSGILAISIVVMKDMLSRLYLLTDDFANLCPFNSYEDLRLLYPELPSRQDVYNCIVSEDTSSALSRLDTLLKDISMMIGYEENKTSIIQYFEYILNYVSKGKSFHEDIETNWRLTAHEKQPRKMEILQASV